MSDYGLYALGTTNPPSKLQALGVTDPHPTVFVAWAKSIDTASGKKRFLGLPTAQWKWGMLLQAEYDIIESLAASRNVYITTRINLGTTPTYSTFSAIAQIPVGTFQAGGLWKDVALDFVNLIGV